MLKYKRLIDNMDVGQKLALLACGGRRRDDKSIIPSFTVGKLAEYEEQAEEVTFPPLRSAAFSWNIDLFGKISSELAFRLKRAGCTAAVTPDFGVNTNPYRLGISEDPCFAGKLAKACVCGITEAGPTPILSGCSLSQLDALYMDVRPDKRVLRDYVVKPFETAVKSCENTVILNNFLRLRGEYFEVNSVAIDGILRRKDFGASVICGRAEPEFAAISILSSLCCLEGDVNALDAAHNRYLRLKQAAANGAVSTDELRAACANGTALSDDVIDEAVDRFLDFAYSCERHSSSAALRRENTVDLSKKISEESIVLLKNDSKVLPFTAERKIAIIGRLAARPEGLSVPSFTETLSNATENKPFDCVGYAEGVDLSDSADDAKCAEASALVMSSDTALVFLGLGRERESKIVETRKLTLPSNQLALLSTLAATEKKIVAVVIGDTPIDLSFADKCSAVLLAPSGGSFGAQALLDVLSGKIDPSGKLTSSCVDGIDDLLKDRKARKNFGRIKIGPFFGYRSPDIRESTRFVFGHGLSYTTFKYSELEAEQDGVKFIIVNTGERAGFETAQVYLGKKDSALARPERELAGFEKIYLEPGESRLVHIYFKRSDFDVLDRADEVRKTEGGEYAVYIGASYADIRLEGTFKLPGQTIMQRENLADFVQSLSNVRSGGYVLKFADECRERFGRLLDWITRGKKSKRNRGANVSMTRENERTLSYRPPLEKLFAAEPDEVDDAEELEESIVHQAPENEILNFRTASDQLVIFMRERGIIIEPSALRRVLSAMAASRLIIARSENSEAALKFFKLLSEYFSAEVCFDDASNAKSFDDLLYRTDETGKLAETALAHALTSGGKQNVVRMAGVSGVKAAFTAECLPFADFADNPEKSCEISPANQNLWDRTFTVPENMWFLLLLAGGERADDLPSVIAETAFVLDISLKMNKEYAEKTTVGQLGYERILHLCAESVKDCAVGENLWKKLDRLEEYVSSRTSYRIGNKVWQRIERYVSVCLSCGGTDAEAMDNVVAGKLLPSMLPLLVGRSESVDLCRTIEKVLGEDNAATSLEFVKNSKLSDKV